MSLGGNDAADGGAFLPGLHRHLAVRFLDENIEGGRAGGDVGAEDRGVEAVLLGDEAHRVLQQVGLGAQVAASGGGAGEADHVLPAQPVEQIAGAARDELQRARGQDTAFEDHPHRKFGDVRCRGGGLDDGGHAREQGGGELFQHPPEREVVGVDMNGDAMQRHGDVLADEQPVLAEPLQPTIEIDLAIGHFAPALGGKHEKRADAAVDVEPVVAKRGAGLVGEIVKRLAARIEIEGKRLEPRRTVVKAHRAQGRAADRLSKIQHSCESTPPPPASAITFPLIADRIGRAAEPGPIQSPAT